MIFVGIGMLLMTLLVASICKSVPQWEKDISDKEQEKFLMWWNKKNG